LKTEKVVFFSLLLGIALTLISTIRFETESVPDLTVARHGLPFPWLHHQTVSIAGTVDIWSVQWPTLVIDLVFWFIISVGIMLALYRYKK
jgi:hypothetical protein